MKKDRLNKLLQHYKTQKTVLIKDLIFAVIGAAISIAIPLLVRHIAENVAHWSAEEAVHNILFIVATMLILMLVGMYCDYFVIYFGHLMGAKMERNMRNELFAHYQELSFSYFDGKKVGKLMSRVTNDIFDLSELLHHGPEEIVISSIKLFGSFAVLLILNWKLALAAFLPVPFMLCFAIYYNFKMGEAFMRNRARIADVNAVIEDNLSGIRVVQSFTNESKEVDKFAHENDRYVESKRDSYRYMAVYNTVLRAMTTLVTIIVAGVGALLMLYDEVAMSDFIVFLLYVGNFTDPIKQLVALTEQLQSGRSGFERYMQVMDIEPEIRNLPEAVDIGDIRGEISFENVSFSYNGGEEVFHGLNLFVSAGEYVALVGSSGVGKTTLCSLIPRFYDVNDGSVKIDGTDVRKVTLESLRRQIGVVHQDVYLFSGTVMENIRYGRPDATDDEVKNAAIGANAYEFINGLPDGFDTNIGQRGSRLSGGQKQRISIARVFLKDPSILVFDEATSALDNESEHMVQESMERLAKHRTTFVIAHRLSTVMNADRILVLTQDGIAEQGTHEELIAASGAYAALYRSAAI